jgi:hypothetical protein
MDPHLQEFMGVHCKGEGPLVVASRPTITRMFLIKTSLKRAYDISYTHEAYAYDYL